MNGSASKLSAGVLKIPAYLYKTLCLSLLVLGLLKFIFDDGSWINYVILAAIGACIWLAGCYGFARFGGRKAE